MNRTKWDDYFELFDKQYNQPITGRKEHNMETIRQQIRYATLSKDERILRESGILSENGNLTEQGRRVMLDVFFAEKPNRDAVVALVKKVNEAKKDSK